MNEVLAELFRYNAWANERLLNACSSLGDRELDSPVAGTFGSIRQTLVHLVGAQDTFLYRLSSLDPTRLAAHKRWRAIEQGEWPGLAFLAQAADATNAALIAEAAAAATKDSMVELPPFQGMSSTAKKSFLLLHAVEHGVEHRTQISTTLAQLGIEAPNLDGWAYAAETPGLVVMDE